MFSSADAVSISGKFEKNPSAGVRPPAIAVRYAASLMRSSLLVEARPQLGVAHDGTAKA
jgi:hypothetical protein